MKCHQSKFQVISITNKVKPIIDTYRIHDHILEQVHCAKCLDVYIDSKLKSYTRIGAIIKKSNSKRAFLARNIARCFRKVKQTANTTYNRPIVEYSLPVWDPHTTRNTYEIEMVQRRCVTLCYCLYLYLYNTGNYFTTEQKLSRVTLRMRDGQYNLLTCVWLL